MTVPALISEVDSTWLRAQQRRRQGTVRHFQVHPSLHYTGRARRYQARGSTSLRLTDKHLLVATAPWRCSAAPSTGRPDGCSGLRCTPWSVMAMRACAGCASSCSPQAHGLLDRWHISQAVRAFTGLDQAQFRRLMMPIWNADSQAALAALRTSPLRPQRPKEFQVLFGYHWGNREGLDAGR